LFFPAVIGRPARVESQCAATGIPVRSTVDPTAGVSSLDPSTAVVSIVTPEQMRSVRTAFCNPSCFFATPDAARLDEESLALFDLLKKPDLAKKDVERIKKVAVELLALLKRKKAEIDNWQAKEQTRDELRQAIHDFLYSDATGLPESYGDNETLNKTDAVYRHAYSILS
jgi:hypothetical protein